MPTIGEITHGISTEGVEEFKRQIQMEAIDNAKPLISDISTVRSALEAGWEGQARANFLSNVEKSTKEINNALDQIGDILKAEFVAIEQVFIDQDKNMIELQ